MKTIQIVMEEELLEAADHAARRAKQNRSALFREALRQHLRRLKILELEQVERNGYLRQPEERLEAQIWEAEAVWQPE